TLKFTFDTVQPDVAYMLSPWSGIKIACKKYVEEVGEDKAGVEPVGSGPYRLTNYMPGSLIEYDAVGESHYRVPPKWDQLRFQNLPELTTRYAALQTGNADLVMI